MSGAPDHAPRTRAALEDLAAVGFVFSPDTRFRTEPYGVCSGVACASLAVIRERRTVLLAPDAFDSPSRLRASLLAVWDHHRDPHPPSACEEARGLWRVLRDGERAGVGDASLLRRAHHDYGRLLRQAEGCEKLPRAEQLPFP